MKISLLYTFKFSTYKHRYINNIKFHIICYIVIYYEEQIFTDSIYWVTVKPHLYNVQLKKEMF